MPRRTLDNPLVPAVLGLLLEQPSHPYQMLAELRKRSDNNAAALNRGSLYNVVAALAEAGWVAAQGQQRAGNRPERTVYALTPTGHGELVRQLDSRIRNPEREFSRFLGAVTYLGALGPGGAAEALTERAGRLRERTAADEERLAEALASGVPRLHVIEAEYALSLARAELAWIDAIVDDIRTGALEWPAGPAGSGAGSGAGSSDSGPAASAAPAESGQPER
ncbi:PadR family transcriptional regulator [Streptomyces iconiensis]|uniref:Helix-turn-helix transcriptional regulator n=1 Tax=Streptomyces iconiensis TaxID=1384038 RepID=A0ABT6ZZP0_9ACTN|nr:helix-turn-helix transcriptional regulator [Streptomyces iconiensis]MDJ1134542.1 helix-turn-helix transcriptional regulator [Streptomyces iconiensis]